MKRLFLTCLHFIAAMLVSSSASAELITSGNAVFQYDAAQLLSNATLTPAWYYDSNNGAATATQAQINAVFFGGGFQGGGAAIPAAATYNISQSILLGPVSSPAGRARQTTNADIDANAALPFTTWSLGEQIGVDGVTVFSSSLGGGIAVGDFSIVYSSALNRLSIVNNYQFTVEAFRVNNPVFTTTANGYKVEGDLLTGDFFPANGLLAGLDVGFFTLNANTTAVPEPSSMAVLALGGLGLGWINRRRRATSCALST